MFTPTKTVLLADDDPNDVELIKMALEECHVALHLVVTTNGIEALDYLYRRNQYVEEQWALPALILLDNKMPKLTGLEVLKKIKEDAVLSLIPVVMLTSSKQDSDIKKSYEFGANAYVVKPMTFNELTQSVQSLSKFWLLTNQIPVL